MLFVDKWGSSYLNIIVHSDTDWIQEDNFSLLFSSDVKKKKKKIWWDWRRPSRKLSQTIDLTPHCDTGPVLCVEPIRQPMVKKDKHTLFINTADVRENLFEVISVFFLVWLLGQLWGVTTEVRDRKREGEKKKHKQTLFLYFDCSVSGVGHTHPQVVPLLREWLGLLPGVWKASPKTVSLYKASLIAVSLWS